MSNTFQWAENTLATEIVLSNKVKTRNIIDAIQDTGKYYQKDIPASIIK